MKISESQLRSIIKKEIINEFFGPFRKKKKPVQPSYQRPTLKERGFERIREFFNTIEEIKRQISGPQQQKILYILNQLPRDDQRYLEEYRKYANKAATGIYSFYSFILPVLDIFEDSLNESTKHPPNDLIAAGYNLYFLIDESFQIKYTNFLESNKLLIQEYLRQASPEERKQIKNNIMLFKRIKSYFDRYNIQDEVLKGTSKEDPYFKRHADIANQQSF